MKKYRVKKLFNSDGDLIDYTKPREVIGYSALHQNEEIVWGDVNTRQVKMEKQNNEEWEIVEDIDAKTNAENKKSNHTSNKSLFENLKVSDLDTVAKLKPVVLQLAKALKELM